MADFKSYLNELLLTTAQQGASDLHLSPGHYPTLRVNSRLVPLTSTKILDRETTEGLIAVMLGDKSRDILQNKKEVDFSFDFEQKARFRVNVYSTKENLAAALRFIPDQVKTPEELNLPPIIRVFTKLSQGFVLVVGPNGHGKSTTLASLIGVINKERTEKVITIEDPIEYIFKSDKSIIDQREVGKDTDSFHEALRVSFRQDMNVIMVGELRDHETISAAVTAAETGHLVFASLHTNSASQTVERIVDTFPGDQQDEIRNQLANTISGIISLRLVPRIRGGLIPAAEIMIATTAIRTSIRDNRLKQLDLVIDTSYDMGMVSLDRSLAELVRKQEITLEKAEFYSLNPTNLHSFLK